MDIPMQSVFQGKVVPVPVQPTKSTGLLVLKPASSNAKLSGGDKQARFTKGPWKDLQLYALTLEERATCPSTCDQLIRCYGNRMLNAVRYRHGPELHTALEQDVQYLSAKHPGGFVVRLHVLGDFYSVDYVEHWGRLARQHAALHIFGYTHREYGTPIGDAVTRLVALNERVRILRSNGFHEQDLLPRAVVIPADSTTPDPRTQVICPEQTGKSASCLTCGLCLSGRTSVSFLDHGTVPHKLIALGRAQRAA